MKQTLINKIEKSFNTTIIIIDKGSTEETVNEGDLLDLEVKILFDKSILDLHECDLESILGYKLTGMKDVNDYFYQLRFGYFNTIVDQIIQRAAIFGMNLYGRVQVSFEIDSSFFDMSYLQKKNTKSSHVFLDLKFEIYLSCLQKNNRISTIYELNESILYNVCLEHKKDANYLYSKNDVISAFMRYKKSMSFLILAQNEINLKLGEFEKKLNSVNGEKMHLLKLKADILETKSQIYSNISICQLKTEDYSNVISNCTNSLKINESNVKALYRRAQAYLSKNETDFAIQDLNRALILDPQSKDIKTSLIRAEKLKKKLDQDMKSKLKNMF
jgi:tetratricopeptide (TPR) repeat protein